MSTDEAGLSTGLGGSFDHLVELCSDPSRSATPVFLVAGAFGNVLNLLEVAQELGPERPVCAIQPHGVLKNQEPHASIETAAEVYLHEVRRRAPTGPYILGGFCSGGVIALEMARQLRRQGETTELLVLLDSSPPVAVDRLRLSDRLLVHVQRLRRTGPLYFLSTPSKYVQYAYGQRIKARDDRTDSASRRSKRVFDATMGALENYEVRPHEGRAVLFRPPLNRVHELGNGRAVDDKKLFCHVDNGWSPWIEDLGIHEIPAAPGDHDGILVGSGARLLAQRLCEELGTRSD